jgi:hypothetical protein
MREAVEILQAGREFIMDDDSAGYVGDADRLDGSSLRFRKRRADDANRLEDVLLDSDSKCNTFTQTGRGCCDGKTIRAPEP